MRRIAAFVSVFGVCIVWACTDTGSGARTILAPTCDGESCAAAAAGCTDGVASAFETDVDCGGPCRKCVDGSRCSRGSDCESMHCEASFCAPPSCDDGVKNATETDIDCGGASCDACAGGAGCLRDSDCVQAFCANGICTVPSCSNGRKDDDESDVDCGGACATLCAVGSACQTKADCAKGGVCDGRVCVACLLDADCGEDNACRSVRCVDKSCAATWILEPGADLPVEAQTPGDCKIARCGSNGEVTSDVDLDDALKAAGDCKIFSCDASSGEPMARFSANDVPQDTDPHDCRRWSCDATTLSPVLVNDAAQVPASDGSPCTNETCTPNAAGNLMPARLILPVNEKVEGGYCDGASGVVRACILAEHCQGHGRNAECSGFVCVCTPSQPCAGLDCGVFDDGCNQTVSCGTCTSPNSCGGGGTQNRCGCTPIPDVCANRVCGTWSNGCGTTFCGGCSNNCVCNGSGQCVSPPSCPTRCGYGGGDVCGMTCPATSACPCTSNSCGTLDCCEDGKCRAQCR